MPPTAPLWSYIFLPLTLKDDLDLTPLKMCSSMRYTCMPNIELLCWILQKKWPKWAILTHIIDLWPWRMTMTLTFQHSKCSAPWDTHACQISSCYVENCKSYGQCLSLCKPTNKPTNKRTGQKQYVPQYRLGDIKSMTDQSCQCWIYVNLAWTNLFNSFKGNHQHIYDWKIYEMYYYY